MPDALERAEAAAMAELFTAARRRSRAITAC
jgi:hypothetical protein